MNVLQAAWRIAAKDLRIEMRTREITSSTALFAVLVVVLASLSFYLDRNTSTKMAPGVLWISVAFSGVLAMGRSWARERENDAMRGLLLSPIPRPAIYLGKLVSIFAFLAVVELLLLPLVGILFHLDLIEVLGEVTLVLFLGTLGFTAAGTLFGTMTVRTTARDLAISVALFPLVAPALLAGVVATREILGGAPPEVVGNWIRILLAFDLVFLAAGYFLFEPLTSD
ncbi:MAG: heme exporter protein CcmB [Myxococcales bacterium]|nr:heme exporter protein CcmB [Myxococcales bacterium]